MPSFSCTIDNSIDPGIRLDRYIAEYLKLLSRSQIKARNLEAHLNGKAVKISRVLKGGEYLELSWAEAESPILIPQHFPLDIIYEDKRVIVVNKAQGMVVHPGAGNRQGTLANALLYRRLDKNNALPPNAQPTGDYEFDGQSTGLRPGIVHRLDKDTSGVIIAAWDEEAHAFLSEQFRERKVRKSYAALVYGRPKETTGCINTRITRSRRNRKIFTTSEKEGRVSVTYYKLIRSYGDFSLLLLRPKTGRTHQIRVHLKYLGNPVIGDPLYGREDSMFKKATLMLHAKKLSIVLPGHEELSTFRTLLPRRFRDLIIK